MEHHEHQIPAMEAPYSGGPSALPVAPAAPAPVTVVSPQFCAPLTAHLKVTEKALSFSGGDFTVTDADGAAVLRVEGVYFSIRNRRVIHDAAGRPILTLQQKAVSMHDTWKVFRGDSTNLRDLLFTVKRTSIFQLKVTMGVFLAGNANTAEQVCDFKIKQVSYTKRSCAFYLGNSNTMIAEMSFSVLRGHTFSVTVFPNVDYVFIAALVVILEAIYDRNSRAAK